MDSQDVLKVSQLLDDMLNKNNVVRSDAERRFIEAVKSDTQNIVNILLEIILTNEFSLNNIKLLALIIICKIIKNEFFSIYFNLNEEEKKRLTMNRIYFNLERFLNFLSLNDNNAINQHIIELLSIFWSESNVQVPNNDIIFFYCKNAVESFYNTNNISITNKVLRLISITLDKCKDGYFEKISTQFFDYLYNNYGDSIEITSKILIIKYVMKYIYTFEKWDFINEKLVKNIIILINLTVSEKRIPESSSLINFIVKIIKENELIFKDYFNLFYENLNTLLKLIINKLDNHILLSYFEVLGLIFRSYCGDSSIDSKVVENMIKILFKLLYTDIDKAIYNDWLEPINLYDSTEDVENNLQTGMLIFDNIFYASTNKKYPLIHFKVYFEYALQNFNDDWRMLYTSIMILSHISEYINNYESMASFIDNLILLLKNCNNPKVVYSCFYALGIMSLDFDQWFFEHYEKPLTETFSEFFQKQNYSSLTNISLQTFVNFYEKSKKNELLTSYQLNFLSYFFSNINQNKYVFIKENSIKSISSTLICLKNRINKEHLFYIIESLIYIASNYYNLENYENCKACVLEAISYSLESIFQNEHFDLITKERLLMILKVINHIIKFLSEIQYQITEYYDKQRYYLNKIWEKLLKNCKDFFKQENNFDSLLSILISLNNYKNDEVSNLKMRMELKLEEDTEEIYEDFFSPVKLIIIGQGIFVLLLNYYKENLKNVSYLERILSLIKSNLMIKLSFDIRNNASFILYDYFEFILSIRTELFKNEDGFVKFINLILKIYLDFFKIETLIDFNYSLVDHFNHILQNLSSIGFSNKIELDILVGYFDYITYNFEYYKKQLFDSKFKQNSKNLTEKILVLSGRSYSQILRLGIIVLLEKYYFNFMSNLSINFFENQNKYYINLGLSILKNVFKFLNQENLHLHKHFIHNYLLISNLNTFEYNDRTNILECIYYYSMNVKDNLTEIINFMLTLLKEDYNPKLGKFIDMIKNKDISICCLGNLIFLNSQLDYLFDWMIHLPFQTKSKKFLIQYEFLMNFLEIYPHIILGYNLDYTKSFILLNTIFNKIYLNSNYSNDTINNKIILFYKNTFKLKKEIFYDCLGHISNENLKRILINQLTIN